MIQIYTVGIDGGGSKTRAVVVDAQGKECGLLHEPGFRSLVLHHIRKHLSIKQIVLVEQPALSAARAALSMTEEGMQAWSIPTLPKA